MIVDTIQKDLLEAKEPFIAHQCNCCTVRAHGLSESLFQKFPFANVYSQRRSKTNTVNQSVIPSVPGTVSVHCKDNQPTILNMMGQYGPGKSFYSHRYYPSEVYKDDSISRLEYFKACLKQLETIVDENDLVAIPFKIGCGLAGGDWKKYELLLKEAKTKFVVYQMEK